MGLDLAVMPMLCCAALIFIVGVIREAWIRLPGTRRPEEPGFAPVALRAAPGEELVTTSERSSAPEPPPFPSLTAWVAVAGGTLLYAVAVYGLLLLRLATPSVHSAGVWIVRDAALAAVLVASVVVGKRAAPLRPGVTPSAMQSAGLLGIGAAWWFLGIVDMHLFHLFTVADGSTGWDLVFHGVGMALILAGALRYVTGPRRAALAPLRQQEPAHVP